MACRLFGAKPLPEPMLAYCHRWIPHTKAIQWRGALMFSLICAWINGSVNNGEAGDLRRHHAHYDVNVMKTWRYFRKIYRLVAAQWTFPRY